MRPNLDYIESKPKIESVKFERTQFNAMYLGVLTHKIALYIPDFHHTLHFE